MPLVRYSPPRWFVLVTLTPSLAEAGVGTECSACLPNCPDEQSVVTVCIGETWFQ